MREFNSQICTSREQSERLLALGLKKETADMALIENWEYDLKDGKFFTGEYFERPIDYTEGMTGHYIPAWSLHRLIELAMCNVEMNIFISRRCFWINKPHHSPFRSDKRDGVYNGMIDYMQWLIEGGYLKKEYLNDENIH